MLNLIYVTVAVLAMLGFFMHWLFLNQLRTKHGEVWKDLGSPTLFSNNTVANSLRVMGFLWRFEYHALGDARLTRCAVADQLTEVLFLFAWISLLLIQW